MTIYVASKAKHTFWWRALRSAGLPVAASWIDSPINYGLINPSSDVWSAHWQTCCEQAAEDLDQ